MWTSFVFLIYLTLNNAQKGSDFYGINTLIICLVMINLLRIFYINSLNAQYRLWRSIFLVLAATGGVIGYFDPNALTAEKQLISAVYGMAWGLLFGLCVHIGRIVLNFLKSVFAFLCQRIAVMVKRRS